MNYSDLKEAQEYCESLRELEPDWNAEGAPSPNVDCIAKAQYFLQLLEDAPSVFPTDYCGVDLVWYSPIGGPDARLQFCADGALRFWFTGEVKG